MVARRQKSTTWGRKALPNTAHNRMLPLDQCSRMILADFFCKKKSATQDLRPRTISDSSRQNTTPPPQIHGIFHQSSSEYPGAFPIIILDAHFPRRRRYFLRTNTSSSKLALRHQIEDERYAEAASTLGLSDGFLRQEAAAKNAVHVAARSSSGVARHSSRSWSGIAKLKFKLKLVHAGCFPVSSRMSELGRRPSVRTYGILRVSAKW